MRGVQHNTLSSRLPAFLLCIAAAAAQAQPVPCLPDADGDGHPLFGSTFQRPDLEYDTTTGMGGGYCTHMEFADLDGDGDRDAVAAVNHGSRTPDRASYLTVLRNRGDGVFDPPTLYLWRPGWESVTVALADFNGDGHADIAVANAGVDTVAVLFNTGDGTFGEPVVYPVGDEPRSLKSGDMDGDGHADLVVLNCLSHDVSVLFNTGTGMFTPEVRALVGGVTQRGTLNRSIAYPGPFLDVGDLDGDGDLDVAVPAGTRIKLLLNDGAGGLALAAPHPAVVGFNAYAVVARDLNGDGAVDLGAAVNRDNTTGLSVVLGLGGGAFAPPVAYDLSWGSPGRADYHNTLAAGDPDHDGDVDLMVGQQISPHFSLLRNRGDGIFMPERHEMTQGPWVVAMDDLNGDGWADFVGITTYGAPRGALRVHLNGGAGRPIPPETYPPALVGPGCCPSQSSIVAADLDMDGDADLIVTMNDHGSPDKVRVLRNDGAGHFEPLPAIPLGPLLASTAEHAAVGDLNGDGLPDLVVADAVEPGGFTQAGTIWVLINEGNMIFAPPVAYPVQNGFPIHLDMGDLDNDGDLDVAAWVCEIYPGNDQTPVDRKVVILVNNDDGVLSPGPEIVLVRIPWSFPKGTVALGDVDGDDSHDLVATAGAPIVPGTLLVVRNNGGLSFGVPQIHAVAPQPQSLRLADLDGDGGLDIVLMHNHNFSPPGGEGIFFEPYLTLMVNDSHGQFTMAAEHIDPSVICGGRIEMGKFGRNRLPAPVLPDVTANVLVPLNDGGALGNFARYSTYAAAWGVAVADFDLDGRPDIAVAQWPADNIVLLRNRGCPASCPADFNGDGTIDPKDFLAYLNAFVAGDPRADFTGDGTVTVQDFLAFLSAFAAGC